jgi:putative transposase
MANTYTQLYVQLVFAVNGRQSLIPKENREELHKYITGIVQKREQKMLSVFCMSDHLHALVGIRPNITISDLVRDVKVVSSEFINDKKWLKSKFNWQEGFDAFTYSKSQIDRVVRYILNQENHHKKRTFKEEYIGLLKKFEVDYDEKYLFTWID